MTTDLVAKGAAAISDLLTMLGVDPDERDEYGGPSTAETLAAAVLQVASGSRVVSVDSPGVRQAIAEAAAKAVNEASASLNLIRSWCDRTEAGAGSSIANAPKTASAEVFGYNAGLMKAVHEIRALLPEIPEAAEEGDVTTNDRDL